MRVRSADLPDLQADRRDMDTERSLRGRMIGCRDTSPQPSIFVLFGWATLATFAIGVAAVKWWMER